MSITADIASRHAPIRGGCRPQILIVDDEATNRLVLTAILEETGCVFHEAGDGFEALHFVETLLPDLILLDIMMPGINGYEVCRRLKQKEETARVPVIFITALNDPENMVEGFRCGAVDYLTKPFHEAEVLARVNNHLELKKAQDQLRMYNENLEQIITEESRELIKAERQAAFGHLIQGIVHNMKSPLTAIRAGAQTALATVRHLVNEKDAIPDEVRAPLECIIRSLEIVETGSKRLTEMINQMMARSHQDHNEKPQEVDLNDIVRDELSFLESDLTFKHRVKKEIKLSASPLPVLVVPGEMSQVVANLVGNAIDAMHGCNAPRITIETRAVDGGAEFIITDNGCGIDPENMKRIFDPLFTTKPRISGGDVFRRGDGPPTGTGLGLYMCQRTVEQAGGSIDVISTLGEGSTFIVRLPCSKPHAGGVQTPETTTRH